MATLLDEVNVHIYYMKATVCILEGEAPLTTGLALQSPPLVLQPNSTGHQLQFKEATQEEQLKRWKMVHLYTAEQFHVHGISLKYSLISH